MNLLRNLWAGLRLGALWPRVRAADFHVSADQVVALSAIFVAVAWLGSYATSEPPRDYYGAAIESLAFRFSLLLGFAYFVSRFGAPGGLVPLLVAGASLLAVERLLVSGVELAELRWPRLGEGRLDRLVTIALWGWLGGVTYRAVRVMTSLPRLRAGLAAVAYAATLWSVLRAVPMEPFFVTDTWSAAANEEPSFDPEQVLYAQPDRVSRALAVLEPQRPDVADLFFVAFAGDATQDVFRKEAVYAKRLFDRRFDTQGRSIALVNSERSLDQRPLATATNLAATLSGIGEQMDRERDVLFLFLTSHGTRSPELTVEFPPLPLRGVSPQALQEMLDGAGIRWRVIVISSCFSGGFAENLEGPETLLMTASAADRESFGCSNSARFTYFGRALFHDALNRTVSFADAFASARASIDALERSEGKDPSLPQIAVGDAIAPVLAALERRLASGERP